MCALMEASVVLYSLRFNTFRARFVPFAPIAPTLLQRCSNYVQVEFELCASFVPTLYRCRVQVGVGMLRGRGIPLVGNTKVQGF